jgi:aminopeptidase N
MERLIEAAAKRDLGWFFEDWVYQDRGLPDFRVQAVHPWTTEKGVQFVTVTLENLGNAGAEVPFTVECASGEITHKIEVRAKSSATRRVELPGVPIEVVVNDGSVPESDLTNNVFKVPAP